MENNVNLAVGVEEQYSRMLVRYLNVLAENRDNLLKMDRIWERILELRIERRGMKHWLRKITDASNLLELLCKAIQSANNKMNEGGISQVQSEWEELKTTSVNPEHSPANVIVEKIKIINTKYVGSKDLSQCVCPISQQGDCNYEKKQLLAAEMELGMQFSKSLLVLEDDLINQIKLLRLDCNQLEKKVERTLSTFARYKLDLKKYKDECHGLHYSIQKCSNALCLPCTNELNKMSSDIVQINKRNAAMLVQWQLNHNILCGFLDDIRRVNIKADKENNNIWQLCRVFKQLNTERMELIRPLLEKTSQGHL